LVISHFFGKEMVKSAYKTLFLMVQYNGHASKTETFLNDY